MSDVDTLKTGGGRAVSFATARLESCSLLPEQLTDLLIETAAKNVDVDLHVESRGTGPSSAAGPARRSARPQAARVSVTGRTGG